LLEKIGEAKRRKILIVEKRREEEIRKIIESKGW